MGSGLEVFSDLSERLNYNIPGFPLYVRKGLLRLFDRYAAACHWHTDLEFILVLDGAMDYFINGQVVRVNADNGIFVNSKRLHYGFSSDNTDCSFLVVAIHPSILGENTHAGRVYVEEKFGPNTYDFILLSPQTPWQQETLLSLKQLYDEMHGDVVNPLRLLSQATSLSADMADHLQPVKEQHSIHQSWSTVCKMTGFIHQNYEHKITLDDIAAAGCVCRSRCCELFSNYIGQTPNNYLIRYRIQKSCEMLKETKRSILEIAVACGFGSPSYFSYAFRKETGLVPQDYRKQASQSISVSTA